MEVKKVVGVHLIADHDFVHHSISASCSCRPEQIAKGVWKHQPSIKYRTYQLYDNGQFDMVLPDEKVEIG